MQLFEQNPDKGGLRDMSPEWDRVLQALAVYLGTSYETLALVENTTTGMYSLF